MLRTKAPCCQPCRWATLCSRAVIERAFPPPHDHDRTMCVWSLSYIGEHLERYSHIRSKAKQTAIQALEERAGESLLGQRGQKSGTVTPSAVRARSLTYWKQMVGAPGFEPGTNG